MFLPIIFIFCFLIWLQDFGNPLYISKRIGKDFEEFNLIKIRSMVLNADKSSRVKGLAFARDCNHGSSLLKLNTIEDKLLNKYFKLMDIYKEIKGGSDGLEKK